MHTLELLRHAGDPSSTLMLLIIANSTEKKKPIVSLRRSRRNRYSSGDCHREGWRAGHAVIAGIAVLATPIAIAVIGFARALRIR